MKTYEKIICFFISAVMLLLLCGCIIQTYRLEQVRTELELCRTELSATENKQSEIRSGLSECIQSVRQTNAILSESANTIAEIRNQISQIRRNYEVLESRLYFLCSINSKSNSTDFTNELSEGEE